MSGLNWAVSLTSTYTPKLRGGLLTPACRHVSPRNLSSRILPWSFLLERSVAISPGSLLLPQPSLCHLTVRSSMRFIFRTSLSAFCSDEDIQYGEELPVT